MCAGFVSKVPTQQNNKLGMVFEFERVDFFFYRFSSFEQEKVGKEVVGGGGGGGAKKHTEQPNFRVTNDALPTPARAHRFPCTRATSTRYYYYYCCSSSSGSTTYCSTGTSTT